MNLIEIRIELTDDGKVNLLVSGPESGNKAQVLGLLELVKPTIIAQRVEDHSSPLFLPNGPMPRNGRG